MSGMEKRERVADGVCLRLLGWSWWMDMQKGEREGGRGRQPNRRSSYTEPWVSLSSWCVYLPGCFAASLLPYHRINSPCCLPHLTSLLARSPGQSLAAAAAGYLLSFSFPVRPHSPPQTSVSDGVMSEVVQSDSMGLKSYPNIGKGSQRLGVSLHDFEQSGTKRLYRGSVNMM